MLTAKQKVTNDVVRAFQRFDEAKLDLESSVERAARIFPDDADIAAFAQVVSAIEKATVGIVLASLEGKK